MTNVKLTEFIIDALLDESDDTTGFPETAYKTETLRPVPVQIKAAGQPPNIIVAFLNAIELPQYAPSFVENRVSPFVLQSADDTVLTELGMKCYGVVLYYH